MTVNEYIEIKNQIEREGREFGWQMLCSRCKVSFCCKMPCTEYTESVTHYIYERIGSELHDTNKVEE